MAQGKAGWWIAGAAIAVVLVSVGYGLGHRGNNQNASSASQALTPAGAPLASIQMEPIQPQQELAAINASPMGASASSTNAAAQTDPAVSQTATPAAAASAKIETASAALPKEESARVREVQQALKNAGFDPGSVDGRMGARTRTAIRDFQIANGLEPDGKVGPRTWAKLEAHLNSDASAANKKTATAKASND